MAFLAKQVVGGRLAAVKADIGGTEGPTEEERAKLELEEREKLLALQETEQVRKKKHDKLEEEREKMRQSVRQKYNIKKRDLSKEEDLRRQQETEMANNIAAMDPRNVGPETSKRPQLEAEAAEAAAAADSERGDFAAKLMSGNVSGAAAQVATKVQALLPQNFSMFKGKE